MDEGRIIEHLGGKGRLLSNGEVVPVNYVIQTMQAYRRGLPTRRSTYAYLRLEPNDRATALSMWTGGTSGQSPKFPRPHSEAATGRHGCSQRSATQLVNEWLAEMQVDRETVRLWRERFAVQGLPGLCGNRTGAGPQSHVQFGADQSGHRTPRMTQRYAHLSPQYMAASVGKLDRVFGQVLLSTDVQQDSMYIQDHRASHVDQKDRSAPLLKD
jgi:hypothetical protein